MTNCPGRPLGGDRGAAALLTLIWLSALLLLAGSGALVLGIQSTRTRVAKAADLSALAAAQWLMERPSQACLRGSDIARSNGARLTACRVEGLDVWVTASRGPVGSRGVSGWIVPAITAQAHATVLAAADAKMTDD